MYCILLRCMYYNTCAFLSAETADANVVTTLSLIYPYPFQWDHNYALLMNQLEASTAQSCSHSVLLELTLCHSCKRWCTIQCKWATATRGKWPWLFTRSLQRSANTSKLAQESWTGREGGRMGWPGRWPGDQRVVLVAAAQLRFFPTSWPQSAFLGSLRLAPATSWHRSEWIQSSRKNSPLAMEQMFLYWEEISGTAPLWVVMCWYICISGCGES